MSLSSKKTLNWLGFIAVVARLSPWNSACLQENKRTLTDTTDWGCISPSTTRGVAIQQSPTQGWILLLGMLLPHVLWYETNKCHITNEEGKKEQVIVSWCYAAFWDRTWAVLHLGYFQELKDNVLTKAILRLLWSLGNSEIRGLLFYLKTIEFASRYMVGLQVPMNYLWRSCWICGTTLALTSKGSKPSVRKFIWKMVYYFHGMCHFVDAGCVPDWWPGY